MKQRLKEERQKGEESAQKKVKTEIAETVEVKLEGHTQVCMQMCVQVHVFFWLSST